jgi:cyclophilin family peptidyl-prolyl cis-trans isomerase
LPEIRDLRNSFCRSLAFGIVRGAWDLPKDLDGMKETLCLLYLLALSTAGLAQDRVPAHPHIQFETTEGKIVLELDGRRAPVTVRNFLELIDSGYFDNTIFHRVIANFMIQGGSFTPNMESKEPGDVIFNESGNGLTNMRGTIAMARTGEPHSAKAQFYINVKDNTALDPRPDRWGYAVFGYVIEGMDIVDAIASVRTGPSGKLSQDVPVVPIVITKASRVVYDD